ncbi:translation initiation factor IF-2 subunit beta [Methanocella arvoryzae]|uniref:Translation initiation factor 2 subunit beta n=1 Tax=Methanocella arvoryzae (strain DSM 22066 / NBRC 105507 / MRE50) TaxID=351160 RepID=Q0W2N2_METAR|nr:translation initiation factor IF-2 subunit beta [Methanocella arvoryzae]CAJ37361.1 translation initiation factor 2, beta subunit [Methanocella arvoryzae MRE50]
MDYDSLLNRGKAELPKSVKSKARFEVPAARVRLEGKKTVIENFGDICDRLNRDPDTVAKYLLREIGTAGTRTDGRITLTGVFSSEQIDAAVHQFVDAYVMCNVCHLPDTRMVKEKRTTTLVCEACGARYPVKTIR